MQLMQRKAERIETMRLPRKTAASALSDQIASRIAGFPRRLTAYIDSILVSAYHRKLPIARQQRYQYGTNSISTALLIQKQLNVSLATNSWF